jgi:hypothetical protein
MQKQGDDNATWRCHLFFILEQHGSLRKYDGIIGNQRRATETTDP